MKFPNQILIDQIESSNFIVVLRSLWKKSQRCVFKVLIKIDIYNETLLLLYDHTVLLLLMRTRSLSVRPGLDIQKKFDSIEFY